MATGPMTVEDIKAYGLTMPLDAASRAVGIGRGKGQQLARQGNFPCRVLLIGERRRVSTADLLAALGVEPAGSATPATVRPCDP